MKKARVKTNKGAMLITIEIMVSGMYFVTEYWIMLVVEFVSVLNTREPTLSRVTLSQVSLFKRTLIIMAMSTIPKTDLIKSIGNGCKFGSRSYRNLHTT